MTSLEMDSIFNNIKEGVFGLVINISVPDKIRNNKEKTGGYFIRRLSIDYGVDILINTKCLSYMLIVLYRIFIKSKKWLAIVIFKQHIDM